MYVMMMNGSSYIFSPFYEDYNKLRTISLEGILQDITSIMKNGDQAEMKRQIDIITDFLNNASYTQFVNVDRFDFMKEAVYGSK